MPGKTCGEACRPQKKGCTLWESESGCAFGKETHEEGHLDHAGPLSANCIVAIESTHKSGKKCDIRGTKVAGRGW